MNYSKLLGILFIVLGIIFVVYPFYSAEAISWIAGICLIAFGFACIIDGFSVWSMMAHASLLNILLGICAILFGILFIYRIDALSFIIGLQFYLIAFVLMFVGFFGIFFGLGTISRLTSVLILILGILSVYIAFAAITMAGKVMDMQAGFAVVNVMDPTSGQQMPLIGSFLYNLAIIVFVVTNGHHMIISALFESFKLVPLLGASPDLSLPLIIARFTTGIFFTGMKIAMPVTFAILLTNVGLGILARTMPQMNIFVVGIPMQLTVGVLILAMVLPFYVLFLDVLFNEMYGNITIALEALQ